MDPASLSRADVVVIAPHPDDEAIGAGALIRGFHQRELATAVVFLTDGELNQTHAPERRRQASAAAQILGVQSTHFLEYPSRGLAASVGGALKLTSVLKAMQPEVLLIPHAQEADLDHAMAYSIGCEAAWLASSPHYPDALSSRIDLVVGYEVWSPLRQPALIYSFGEEQMEVKRAALACYNSENRRYSLETAAHGLGEYRGSLFGGSAYAEAFSIAWCGGGVGTRILIDTIGQTSGR